MSAVRSTRGVLVLAFAAPLAAGVLLAGAPPCHPPDAARIDRAVPGTRHLSLPFVEVADAAGTRYVAATFAGSVTVGPGGAVDYALPGGTRLRERAANGRTLRVRAGDRSGATVTVLRGADAGAWRSGLPAVDAVRVAGIAEGVELEVVAGARNVEKRFLVAPGADVDDVRMRFDGAARIGVLADGRLEVATERGAMTFTAPVAFQETARGRTDVPARYVVDGDVYGFAVEGRDPSLALVIDPLIAATYLGGRTAGDNLLNDTAEGIATHDGSVYVVGSTQADIFPDDESDDPVFATGYAGGTYDAYVCRVSADLSNVEAVTYLGGAAADVARAVAVTTDGVFVAGYTTSTDFPTTVDVVQPGHDDGAEVFVARLSHDLTQLTASTYLGGTGTDEAYDIAVDPQLGVVVTGRARSPDLGGHVPATAYQPTNAGVFDAFVVRLSPTLGTVLGATLLGGTYGDEPAAVAIDGAQILICGTTSSTDLPVTQGAFDTTYVREGEGFVARFDGALRNLLACTYLGGEVAEYPTDECTDIAVQGGDVLVCGMTESEDFPSTPGTFDPTPNISGGLLADAFVVRLSADLTTLRAGTFVGGTATDDIAALAVHEDGIVLVGRTYSTDFPFAADSEDAEKDGFGDAFVLALTLDLTQRIDGRYLGGEQNDGAEDVVLDGGVALITGNTYSRAFPTTAGAFDRSFNDELNRTDGFIVSYDMFEGGVTPPVDIDSYILPKRLDVRRNARKPEKSRLNAGGWFDSGADEVDWSQPATLTIGDATFQIPGLVLARRQKGWWEWTEGATFFRIKPSRYGSSKAKFKLKWESEGVGAIPIDAPLLVRFQNQGVDAIGEVALKDGRYKLGRQRGALIQPRLALYSCRTTVKGDGKDALRARLGVCTEGGVPNECPPLTIGLDDHFAGTIDSDAFDLRNRKFVFKGPAGGLSQATVDFGKEKLAIRGTKIDVGDYPEGAQAVAVLVQLGDDALVLHVRMVRKGKTMRY